MFCCKTKECKICYEYKKGKLCKLCSKKICQDCLIKLCENGLCKSCPYCRQENWKNNYNTKIFPIPRKGNRSYVEVEYEDIDEIPIIDKIIYLFQYCFQIIRKFIIVIGLLIVSYLIGLMLIFIFYSNIDFEKNYYKYWLPFVASLLLLVILLSPCCLGQYLYTCKMCESG